MRTYFKYIAIATFAVLLCSCNKEISPDAVESQVQIAAKIAPCLVTRVTDDGTAFSDGDAIKVQNTDRESKNLATYTYTASTGKWNTSDELYWDGESENTFNAWYPTTAQYSSFTIPSDQSAGITSADWMTATASAKKADGNVELAFNHNLAKVTVTIESWSNEYAANEKVVNSLELNSLSSTMSNDGSLSGDNVAKWIKTYVSQANTSYVAIVAPGTYTSAADIMQVYVNGSATALKVKSTSTVVVESGKAYNFRLTIGKDLAAISSSITVNDWDGVALDNQQATAEVIKKIDYIDEFGINHGKGVEIDGVIWAPVNCGYHATDFKYGKLYQWGRKYGQGYSDENYSDAIAPVIASSTPTLEEAQSIDNQNVYYNGSSDWYSGSRTIQLWNEGTEDTPIKSSNDPCPTGWRVPTKTELYALTDNYSEFTQNTEGQYGYYFSGSRTYSQNTSQIFLPAAGWRNYGNASMTSKNQYRDVNGCYYSSTLPENSSYRVAFTIDFGSDGVDTPPNSAERANAFSVRCVKE
jgi:uncharacterized protein (TIGR02145 family)